MSSNSNFKKKETERSGNIGIFGGSFDPVHFGHLILVRHAMEELGLEKVLFLPAGISPHKTEKPPAGAKERLEMLEAAIQGEEGFYLDPRELLRSGVSYAIETVRELEQDYPNARFFYFIGEDNLRELHTWREIEELKKKVRFVVFSRNGKGEATEDMSFISRQIEISSTEIRNRVAQGRSIRYLVPEKVYKLITEKNLYVIGTHGS